MKHLVPQSIRLLPGILRDRMHRFALRRRLGRIHDRYRDASMIPREAFLDNLELIAAVLERNPRIEGAIVECGTWRGGMAAAMMELGGADWPYHFFDSFEGLPPAQPIDGEAAVRYQQERSSPWYFDNCTASEEDFLATLARTGLPCSQVHVHRGFFEQTVPAADTGPIAVLRLDADWYESTRICLEHFFPRVVSGGLVLIDDYGIWDGCTRAVHEYLSMHRRPEPIERYGRSRIVYLHVR